VTLTANIILGGPGTGKTTYLLDVLDKEMQSGVQPHRVAFMSFTKKAASEAMLRACEKFDYQPKQFPYFKTIHALTYAEAGVKRNMVMQPSDHKRLAQQLGLKYSGYNSAQDGAFSGEEQADVFLSVVKYANATCQSLHDAWHNTGSGVDWHRLKQYDSTLRQFKRVSGKVDFDDMLQIYIDNGEPLDIDVAIIDEAQDLSAMQWGVVRKLIGHAKRVYVAGDDDQALYKWSGADVDQFVDMEGDVTVLPLSHRLPKLVHHEAEKLVARIQHRRDKQYNPTDKEGSINWITELDKDALKNGESWYLLARNSYLLKGYTETLQEMGVPYKTVRGSSIKQEHVEAIIYWERLRKGKALPGDQVNKALQFLGRHSIEKVIEEDTYTLTDLHARGLTIGTPWHEAFHGMDAENIYYYLDILRNGYKLYEEPQIYLGTIHSVKGGEADNVVLCVDMTYRTYMSMQKFADDEHRVFYVGATRTKKNLYYMTPKTNMYYEV